MKQLIKFLLHEPLIHFLFLGAIVYIYYAYDSVQNANSRPPIDNKIVIKIENIEDMKAKYLNKETNSSLLIPMKIFTKAKYYDAVLLHEAYSLNLDKNDIVIQNKLLQKMKYILANSVTYKEPSEKELYEYYKKNIKEYSKIESLSFSDICFINSKNKMINKTYNLLKTLKVYPGDAKFYGDRKELEKQFGHYFVQKLFRLKTGVWQKPIESKNGVHIVNITKKTILDAYPFDEVQDRVYQDYLDERQTKVYDDAMNVILQNYVLVTP